MSLRFAEEIILLALDDQSGKLRPLPDRALELAVAGGLLMELAFANRIDTDQKQLTILDRSPTGDTVLDSVLQTLPEGDTSTIRQAISRVAADAPDFKDKILKSLVEKGILNREEHRFFFVLKERRYPMVDDREEKEVISRIRDVVIDGAIPDPKDVVLICLMNACDLSSAVFSDDELEQHSDRINQVARMDFIGQALAKAIAEIQEAILETISYMGM
ncbi:GOLPH3/VPS74 family protein [Rubellicoccus peritrichatus]|uniref:GPP34 family phosphoprotein n=1 Tax=Rubellicoccus peritrichatus TaxID=3080537 RepID=A0AAQ3LBJ6_9BACT|nr:GPP34 family phosphoprotein [Puniceicoccus sp. CR14]WOO42386.1 GPP34 family phosphoprotein [Puniceicoccus sp. CR14]